MDWFVLFVGFFFCLFVCFFNMLQLVGFGLVLVWALEILFYVYPFRTYNSTYCGSF